MTKIVVLGAGISGHTAAAFIKKKLGKAHDVVVVSPGAYYQWIPSNIWVGVGKMTIEQVRFKLQPVYDRWKIDFRQAKATAIFPEGDKSTARPYISIEYTGETRKGETDRIDYDYLVNATGPKLNFAATEGLGPEKFTHSVCSCDHAVATWAALQNCIARMEKGEKLRFLIGTGHPTATCQGAAFEYALNLAYEIKSRGLSLMAEITWISNEYELGDFGMGGAFIKRGGYVTPTKVFSESIFAEYGVLFNLTDCRFENLNSSSSGSVKNILLFILTSEKALNLYEIYDATTENSFNNIYLKNTAFNFLRRKDCLGCNKTSLSVRICDSVGNVLHFADG